MLAAQRRTRILAELQRSGAVRVSDLVDELGVSDMTVRRDLVVLQRQGMLDKVYGGAVSRAEPSTAEPGFEASSSRQLTQKEAIAAYAATFVQSGSAIAISGGTTTHAFARHLVSIPHLTVVTNSLPVADVLHKLGNESMTVLLTGGTRTPSDALVGPVATATLRSLQIDAVYIGVHGMDEHAGFSTPNLLEAETNRIMISAARRLVVLADSSKWGVVGLSSMARLRDASLVVTDSGLPAHATRILFEQVDDVIVLDVDRGSDPRHEPVDDEG